MSLPPFTIVTHEQGTHAWRLWRRDGLAIGHDAVVEIKCGKTTYRTTLQTNAVPDYHYGQLQHILAVTGLESIDFWCYWPGSTPLLLAVPRDPSYIELLLEKEWAFWQRVQENPTVSK